MLQQGTGIQGDVPRAPLHGMQSHAGVVEQRAGDQAGCTRPAAVPSKQHAKGTRVGRKAMQVVELVEAIRHAIPSTMGGLLNPRPSGSNPIF